ncbi:MAG: ribonuclease III [Dehalococcoidia bacterium]|nr:ribonuclease III [Dehalococcoidia bacterium]
MDDNALKQLQDALGLSFGDEGLLRQALTHPSHVNEHPEEAGGSNQRLEFLGDAVIDLVVARELYERLPGLDEGDLTELRSQVVRGQVLARVARRLGLGQYLLLGQGEEGAGGSDRDSNLAAALEALVGAVFLDRGYGASQRLVSRILEPELAQVRAEGVSKDPKSELQERMQHDGRGTPSYQMVSAEGPPHQRRFTVQVVVDGQPLGTGQGPRRVDAERQAALQALKAVD